MHKTLRWLIPATTALLLTGCDMNTAEAAAPAPSTEPAEASHSSLWKTDYKAALATAAAENKHVLVDFSGSDWCGWCIKLEKEVFSKDEFIEFAKENLILVLVDFPRQTPQPAEQKAANEALAQKYGIRGFPTVLILSPEGNLLKQTGYQQGGPGPYVQMIQEAIEQ